VEKLPTKMQGAWCANQADDGVDKDDHGWQVYHRSDQTRKQLRIADDNTCFYLDAKEEEAVEQFCAFTTINRVGGKYEVSAKCGVDGSSGGELWTQRVRYELAIVDRMS
jgi:hypothetical protein